ncbi:MAG: hypothetical protein AB1564_09520 [Chloroflexota bacterium]
MTDAFELARRRIEPLTVLGLARLSLTILALLIGALAWNLGGDGVMFVYWRRTLLVLALAGLSAGLFGVTFLTWTKWRAQLESLIARIRPLTRLGWLNWLGFLICVFLPLFAYMGPFRSMFTPLANRYLFIWCLSLAAAYFLAGLPVFASVRRSNLVLFALLALAFVYLGTAILSRVSSEPFSLKWSEATRYYHASLLLSERYYGMSLPPFYQDLSRYVLEAVPLLLPRPTILIQRVWEMYLAFFLALIVVLLLLRRIGKPVGHRLLWFACLVWGIYYLYQAPIFHYLLVTAIPVLAWFDVRRPVRSALAVVVASLWAGISRINWAPIPAMLAVAMYLMEVPVASRPLWRYLLPPALYSILGLSAALAARQWYLVISGIAPEMYNMAFTSTMLWYRLFPTSWNSIGILPSGLIAAAPVVALMVYHLRTRSASWHWIRLFGLGAILFILLTGGMIVSAKIGGGNNLHNLDTYFLLSLVIVIYLIFDRFVPDHESAPVAPAFPPLLIVLTVLTTLVIYTRHGLTPGLPIPPNKDSQRVLAELQAMTDETVADGGQVLFITQRHLLTYDLLHGVPLVPEYDNIALMEAAMTGFEPTLRQFVADVSAHKYALIIAPEPPGRMQTSDDLFAEENNAWLREVSVPLLRYYKVSVEYKDLDFVVMVPKQ